MNLGIHSRHAHIDQIKISNQAALGAGNEKYKSNQLSVKAKFTPEHAKIESKFNQR